MAISASLAACGGDTDDSAAPQPAPPPAPEEASLATDGIPDIDSATGNPDVHLNAAATGVTAYYSQDIGAVTNFAIQPVAINTAGDVTQIGANIVLAKASFDFDSAFSPANFPVESEFLDGLLFVAHFAAQGVEVIDTANGSVRVPIIPLPHEPTNIATDGTLLFVVGLSNATVDIIDPGAGAVMGSLSPSLPLSAPIGVAALGPDIQPVTTIIETLAEEE